MIEAYKKFWKGYVDFEGRSTRSDYWFAYLANMFFAFGIAAILPGIAVTVRRLRDAGYNWPYIFISLIPFVGPIIFIVLLCKPTKVDYPFNNFNNPQQ